MTADSFLRLYEITKKLRSENGCPWDKKQTPSSLRGTFIEETFEAVDAITEGDALHAREELGDVFFNLMLISFCYEQAGDFTIEQLLDEISEKLVRRHPHVFGNAQADTAEKVIQQWDKIKEEVEGRKAESVLDTVPEGFPPLLKAYKFLKKAAKAGFDWRSAEQAESKVYEELKEISGAAEELRQFEENSSPDKNTAEEKLYASHVEEEAGDMLLSAVNYCRRLGVDPNVALERACVKFSRRFRHVEKSMAENQLKMTESNDEQMMAFWNEAKSAEKNGKSAGK